MYFSGYFVWNVNRMFESVNAGFTWIIPLNFLQFWTICVYYL